MKRGFYWVNGTCHAYLVLPFCAPPSNTLCRLTSTQEPRLEKEDSVSCWVEEATAMACGLEAGDCVHASAPYLLPADVICKFGCLQEQMRRHSL